MGKKTAFILVICAMAVGLVGWLMQRTSARIDRRLSTEKVQTSAPVVQSIKPQMVAKQASSAEPSTPGTHGVSEPDQADVSSVKIFVRAEAEQMNAFDGGRSEVEIDQIAMRLSENERRELVAMALDTSLSENERTVAIVLLTRAIPNSIPELSDFLVHPVAQSKAIRDPHSVEALKAQFETSLRLGALEALDGAGVESTEAAISFKAIASKTNDQTVRMLAQIALIKGPGKLKRAIDEILSGKG